MKKTISILPPNWLGDVIMAQPAMRAIIENNPDFSISLSGRPWLKDLLPFLNLKQAEYKAEYTAHTQCFLFRNSFHAAWQAFRSKSAERHGFKHEWRHLLLTHAYTPKLNMQHEHHRDYFLDLVEQAGIKPTQREVSLCASQEDLQAGQALLKEHDIDPQQAICVAPGAQFGGAKRYPAESYAHILKRLSQAGYQIVILGTEAERVIGESCIQGCQTAKWNASGQTNLRQAIQLIAASRLTLCNDSGLMHVSAGLGKPTVGIFGATDPSRTAPSGEHVQLLYRPAICSPCLQRECHVLGHPCMSNILPEDVYQSCLSLLKA